MRQRIQKLLANAGVASRRNVEEMVRQRRVAVNGKVVSQLPILIDPAEDHIEVDGQPVTLRADNAGKRIYILLNKPKHVYSTNLAQGEQRLAIDLLPPNLPGRVYPVGRLDADSKGLLLLTNDGDLTHRLTHPRYGVPKTYRATVDGSLEPRDIESLSRGIWLTRPHGRGGSKTGMSHIKIIHRSRTGTILEITIREGRNRQIRRMLADIGRKVRDLTRIKIGPLTLHGLSPGEFRHLTSKEVHQLRMLTDPSKSQRRQPEEPVETEHN